MKRPSTVVCFVAFVVFLPMFFLFHAFYAPSVTNRDVIETHLREEQPPVVIGTVPNEAIPLLTRKQFEPSAKKRLNVGVHVQVSEGFEGHQHKHEDSLPGKSFSAVASQINERWTSAAGTQDTTLQGISTSGVRGNQYQDRETFADDTAQEGDYLRHFRSPYVLAQDIEMILKAARAEQNSPEYQHLHPEDKSVARMNRENTKTVAWYGEGFRERFLDEDAFDLCPVSNCKVIPSSEMHLADAVLFHGIFGREKPPPKSHAKQIYVLYDMEPPIHVSNPYWTDEWNDIFNWTWNYRRDSDIWEPVSYLKLADKIPSKKHLKAVTASKTRAVAWFVSDCKGVSRRDEYAQALREHGIDVDIYGLCGNLSCPKSDKHGCLYMLTKRYYFYLSFENALCHGYVTEKFFNKFQENVHVLPIVLGGADYSRFFPQGTYIDVSWFRHPKDLANCLKTLMADPDRYTHLLWRKAHFDFADRGTPLAVCELCRRLHDLNTYGKWYDDVKTWRWDGQCFPPEFF